VQDATNEDAAWFVAVKHNMLSLQHASQARTDFVARPTKCGIISQKVATFLQFAEITVRLGFAPCAKSVEGYLQQIRFGQTRETNSSHSLARCQRKIELSSDAFKDIAISDATRVAGINCATQRIKLRLSERILPIQSPQCCADNLARILVLAACDFGQHKAVEFVGQIDVACWHTGCFL